MQYTTQALAAELDCDELIDFADETVDDLTYRKTTLERQRNSSVENTTDAQAELAGYDTEIAALTPLVPTLPEGTNKKTNERRLRHITYRRGELIAQLADNGPVGTLKREQALARVIAEIAEVQAFRAAIVARKAAL